MVKLSGESVEVAEGGEGGGDGERLDGESGNVLHGGHHLVGEVGLHAVDPGHAQTVVQAVDQAKAVVKAVDKASVLDKAIVEAIDKAGALD